VVLEVAEVLVVAMVEALAVCVVVEDDNLSL
jgi:hypothetical protein